MAGWGPGLLWSCYISATVPGSFLYESASAQIHQLNLHTFPFGRELLPSFVMS